MCLSVCRLGCYPRAYPVPRAAAFWNIFYSERYLALESLPWMGNDWWFRSVREVFCICSLNLPSIVTVRASRNPEVWDDRWRGRVGSVMLPASNVVDVKDWDSFSGRYRAGLGFIHLRVLTSRPAFYLPLTWVETKQLEELPPPLLTCPACRRRLSAETPNLLKCVCLQPEIWNSLPRNLQHHS